MRLNGTPVLIILMLGIQIPLLSIGQDTDPFAQRALTGKSSSKAGWGAGAQLRIPVDDPKLITLGGHGCPLVGVGSKLWSITEAKVVATIKDYLPERGRGVLSNDGRWFAMGVPFPFAKGHPISVWSASSGEEVLSITPNDKEASADVLLFLRNKYLVWGGRHSNELEVWDVENERKTTTISLPARNVEKEKIAFTPDAQYYACVQHKSITVHSTRTHQVVVTLSPPGKEPQRLGSPNPRATPLDARRSAMDPVFTYSRLAGLQFSFDGEQIAAISNYPIPRLICWDKKGEITFDHQLGVSRLSSSDVDFQWLADGTGWIVDGNFFDKKSKRVVMRVAHGFGDPSVIHVVDDTRILAITDADEDVLRMITIPWQQIRDSVAQMSESADALLSPGRPISIDVSIENARGPLDETEQVVKEAIETSLAQHGIDVAENQPTVVELTLVEKEGEKLPIYERTSRFDFRGKATGEFAMGAIGETTIVIKSEDGSEIWRNSFNATSARTYDEDITNEVVRRSMLDSLARQLSTLEIPYYVTQSKDALSLPLIVH